MGLLLPVGPVCRGWSRRAVAALLAPWGGGAVGGMPRLGEVLPTFLVAHLALPGLCVHRCGLLGGVGGACLASLSSLGGTAGSPQR